MRTLLIVQMVLLATSCCAGRFAAPAIETRDSVVIREVEYIERVRDTTIFVTLPKETRETAVKRDSSWLETSVAESFAGIGPDGTLLHTLSNKQLELPVPVSVTERSTVVSEQKEKGSSTVVRVRLPLRGWEKFLVGCGITFCAVVLCGIFSFIIKLLK